MDSFSTPPHSPSPPGQHPLTQHPENYHPSSLNASSTAGFMGAVFPFGSNWTGILQPSGTRNGTMREDHRDQEISELKQQLFQSLSKVAELEGTVVQKDSELEGLKALLSMHDESSGAEISGQLDCVNDRIKDFAELIASQWTETKYQALSEPMQEKYRPSSKDVLGSPLRKALQLGTPEFNYADFLLQYAFCTTIIHGILPIFALFAFTAPAFPAEFRVSARDVDDLCYKRLGAEILRAELQSSYGHWRSMTHKYLGKALPDVDYRRRVEEVVRNLQRECYQISLLLFKNEPPPRGDFYKDTGDDLREIVEQAIRLAKMIRETVITRNYEVHCPSHGTLFSQGDMTLEEREKGETQPGRVVCAIAIGLSYTTKSGTEQALGQTIFRKATVVTDHILAKYTPRKS